MNPHNAIIAVTLNCNSRCVMCHIWKNRIKNELDPSCYLKLPSSLTDINITGGEPFLRHDLPEIVKNIKLACPQARLILNSNGFLPAVIDQQIPKILAIDPRFAVRLSLDGWQNTHDQIRKIKNGFNLVLKSLTILKKHGVKDLGISFTIMENNYHELEKIYDFCAQENIELSLTLVSNSPIYFGQNSIKLYPQSHAKLSAYLSPIIKQQYRSIHPKNWLRAWFNQNLLEYHRSRQRKFNCTAAHNFFYLDSTGNIYACHLKNWKLGNLNQSTFKQIWESKSKLKYQNLANKCQDCWMICTAKNSILNNLPQVVAEVAVSKIISSIK